MLTNAVNVGAQREVVVVVVVVVGVAVMRPEAVI